MPRTIKSHKLLRTKRGDTIIEVMFAFAIFSMVAIVTVMMMNRGVASAERSLELTVARNEINAQAEALRFIHSSYISELTLPSCSDVLPGEKCQQYEWLWRDLTSNAYVRSSSTSGRPDSFNIEYPPQTCQEIYDSDILAENHAFVLNTRKLLSENSISGAPVDYRNTDAIIRAQRHDDPLHPNLFNMPPLGARIIYSWTTGQNAEDGGNNSATTMARNLTDYTKVASVEGIWVVAVAGTTRTGAAGPQYYDFYIQSCWYGADSPAPSALDSIVRLYNPEGVGV